MAGDYSGDLSPDEAMAYLEQHPDAVLIDVRTEPEWAFVGVPDLSAIGRQPMFLEWQSYPAMTVNPDFVAGVKQEIDRRGAPAGAPLLFLCRSGARSRAAAKALFAEGHAECFNVAGGFEGGPDPSSHRGHVEGWKARDLPWRQS